MANGPAARPLPVSCRVLTIAALDILAAAGRGVPHSDCVVADIRRVGARRYVHAIQQGLVESRVLRLLPQLGDVLRPLLHRPPSGRRLPGPAGSAAQRR